MSIFQKNNYLFFILKNAIKFDFYFLAFMIFQSDCPLFLLFEKMNWKVKKSETNLLENGVYEQIIFILKKSGRHAIRNAQVGNFTFWQDFFIFPNDFFRLFL